MTEKQEQIQFLALLRDQINFFESIAFEVEKNAYRISLMPCSEDLEHREAYTHFSTVEIYELKQDMQIILERIKKNLPPVALVNTDKVKII
tara:strand:+ start:718 stop:990 length:273 start_codon:yes stop_codon:yes gene_type:complete